MFEIFGQGTQIASMIERLNSLSSLLDINNISDNVSNFDFYSARYEPKYSSRIMQMRQENNINIYNRSTQQGVSLVNPIAKEKQSPTIYQLFNSIVNLGSKKNDYSPTAPITKLLLSTQTFAEYKETRKYDYFKASQIVGFDSTKKLTRYIGIYYPKGGVIKDSEDYIGDTSAYDNYYVPVGLSLYDDDNKLVSRYHLLYFVKLTLSNIKGNYYDNTKLIPGRKTESISYNDSYISNYGGTLPNESLLFPLSTLFNDTSGYQFNPLIKTWVLNRKIGITVPTDTSRYEANLSDSVAPFEYLAFNPRNNILGNFYKFGDITKAFSFNCANGISLFRTQEDLINYLTNMGFRVYLTLDDLINDITADESDTEVGYDPKPDPPAFVPDNSSDEILPTLPNISPSSVAKTYCLKMSDYLTFNEWISSTNFLEALKKYFTDPLDGVLSLKLFPFDFLQHDSASLSEQSKISIVNQSKEIHSYLFRPQYNAIFNGGEYFYTPYFGDFNDYIASYSIYVPFIGNIALSPEEVVNKTIKIIYGVDILSGQCQVLIYSNAVMIRSLSGICGLDIPLTGTNYTQAVRNAINYAVGLGTQIAVGQLTGLPAMSMASTPAPSMGNNGALNAGGGGSSAGVNITGQGAAMGVQAAVSGVQTYLSVLPQNAQIMQSKSSPCTALFSPQTPFLTVSIPQPVYPAKRVLLEGYNSSLCAKIRDLNGFIKGTAYGEWNIGCTSTELEEIKSLIQAGIYI